MRGASASFGADVGPAPRVVESGTTHMTVRLGNAQVTLHGSLAERRALVEELAKELGIWALIAEAAV